jgi:hypothetical protein
MVSTMQDSFFSSTTAAQAFSEFQIVAGCGDCNTHRKRCAWAPRFGVNAQQVTKLADWVVTGT